MIIDLNTRIWESTAQLGAAVEEQMRRRRGEPWERPAASTDLHDEAMARVERAVILGFESRHLDASISHEKVAEYVQRRPDRYLGFMGIDPTAGKPIASLERGLELGLVGVTISPSAQGFHPTDTRAMDLYEACEERGVPLFFEADTMLARPVKMEFGQPYMIDEVARTFPNLRVAISSLGNPWVDQAIALIGKHPTVYADISDLVLRPWQLYNALLLAHQQGVLSQIVFGSGFPFCTPERAIVTLYSINTLIQGTHLPSVPREQLRSIVERDALGCLGLRDRVPASAPTTEVEEDDDADAGDDEANESDPAHATAAAREADQ